MLQYQTIGCNKNEDISLLVDPPEDMLVIDSEEGNVLATVHVNIPVCEAVLDNFFGYKLADIPLGGGGEQRIICSELITRYSNTGADDDFFSELSNELFEEDVLPSAMWYENSDDLVQSIFMMYQLSYAHYVLGKHYRMNGNFPSFCCGRASRNVLTALWEAGIVSAIQVWSTKGDHDYLIVPFVTPHMEGVIVIDPTSDQLMKKQHDKIRNLILIKTRENWSYKTDWAGGKNLYPRIVGVSACCEYNDTDYDDYLKEAFQNPVVVV